MRTESKNSRSGKVATWSIVGVVLAGTLLISGISDLAAGSGAMARIFFLFLGAIIVVQVIPCIMLLGAMLKVICGLFVKKAKVKVRDDMN